VEVPTASCQNIQVTLVANSVSITADQIDNGSSDNCSVALSASPTTFDCSHLGQVVPVQLTVADAAGNSATCTANVTVMGVCDEVCPSIALFVNAPTHSQMGTVANWAVPGGGVYKVRITADGAKGGKGGNFEGGAGASMIGDFIVSSGQVLDAIAGAPGASTPPGDDRAGGGGGGSGVQLQNGTALILSGGGGGGKQRAFGGGSTGNIGQVNNSGDQGGASAGGGGGGGGYSGNGANGQGGGGGGGFNGLGGAGTPIGGAGGGGFGGGGGGYGGFGAQGGGGGGGYSGGDGNSGGNSGQGGGSINLGANQNNTAGANNAGGQVLIECLGPADFTADFTPTQPACANPTQGSLSIDLTGDNDGNLAGLEYAIVAGNSFSGTPAFSDISADPFDITSGFGTTGDFGGKTYTVRIRLKYNPGLYVDETYTLTAPCNCTIYVNDDAAGANNGTSWTDAFTDLQDALSCSGVTEIWVAAGTYKPTSGTDRSISFSMQNNLAIYGGFPGLPGQEGDFNLRDWAAKETILSGDIGTANDAADNSYHVILNNYNGLNNTAVLDGFTITGGHADGSWPHDRGGGMYNSLVSPLIVNCSFIANHATRGGGVYNTNPSTPTFVNCLFYNNLANDGGGAFNDISSARFQNCSFSGNSGFAISNVDATPSLANCIIWSNGAGIKNLGSASSVAGVSYSIIQGGYSGTDNLDEDPLFVDPAAGDFQLQPCSPAIDAGDNGATTTAEDLGGNPRIVDASGSATVDMGAYEFQGMRPGPAGLCQNITVQLGTDNTATVLASQLDGGSTGCGPLSFLIDGQATLAFDCGGLGQQMATLTVTDAFGNQAACNAAITVADDDNPCCAAPAAACKPFTAVLDAGGSATLTAGDVDGGSTYECGLQSMTVSPNAFSCADAGPQTVTLTVTDVNNESSSCNAQVTVKDETRPVARCRNRTIELNAAGTASITAVQVSNGSNDNCSLLGLSLDRTNFSCSDVGVQSVTLTATDGSNNSHSCIAMVAVQDHVAPVALCQDIIVQLGGGGSASLTAGEVDDGSSDACGIGSRILSRTTFTCADLLGPRPVTLTVADPSGNASACSAGVTVRDDIFSSCPDPCPNDPDDDLDNDGLCGNVDNCPATFNPGQEDLDRDGQGDACDPNFCINTFIDY
ncbi:MAG: right-handed parallel beta-helix repeat-containing protein, partial [Phaeodactylibacter sp.]|nr:right-handed parallel beta-helix repeat-containing protein [Phaeodactylibacter sp.]